MLDNAALLRYSRNILLPEVGVEGQLCWSQARLLLVGAGGLGIPIAMQLASLGIGTIDIVDPDTIEIANLNRQFAYYDGDVGKSKVSVLKHRLAQINPDLQCDIADTKFEDFSQRELAKSAHHTTKMYDCIIDTTDNLAARLSCNAFAVASKIPLLSAAVIRFDGQVALFTPQLPDRGCYHCLFGAIDFEENCTTSGILAPMANFVASIASLEVARYLLGESVPSLGHLLTIQGKNYNIRQIALRQDAQCRVCK